MKVRVVTANIKGTPLMRQSKVTHDVERVASMADVVLWQEIGKRRYKRAVSGLEGWSHAHLDLEVPISWRSELFELVYRGHIKTHDGKRRTSPNRYISWAVLRHLETGELIAFCNSHYVSGAWNKKRKRNKEWRKRMWLQHRVLHKRAVASLAQLGVPVIGGGDFNRVKVKPLYKGAKWLTKGGIDYLFAVEHDRDISTHAKGKLPGRFYTDHQPRRAVVTIT